MNACVDSRVSRFGPPSDNGYSSIMQFVQARPSITYSLSFHLHCPNSSAGSSIIVHYAGLRISDLERPSGMGAQFSQTTGIPFTTSVTKSGWLGIRGWNTDRNMNLFYDVDDVAATTVETY